MDVGPDEILMATLKAQGRIKDGKCFERPYGWRILGTNLENEPVDYAVSKDGTLFQVIKGGKDNG